MEFRSFIVDNNLYETTGSQTTVASVVNFVEIAAACGYAHVYYINDLNELKEVIANWKENEVLTFVYIKIIEGSKEKLGRPQIKPHEVKERLIKYLS